MTLLNWINGWMPAVLGVIMSNHCAPEWAFPRLNSKARMLLALLLRYDAAELDQWFDARRAGGDHV